MANKAKEVSGRATGNPQLEHGYMRLANEMMDVIVRYPWPGTRSIRLFLAILRLSYGYRRKYADIGYTRFARITGLDRRAVARGLRELIERNIIFRSARLGGENSSRRYQVNKLWQSWSWGDIDVPSIEEGILLGAWTRPRSSRYYEDEEDEQGGQDDLPSAIQETHGERAPAGTGRQVDGPRHVTASIPSLTGRAETTPQSKTSEPASAQPADIDDLTAALMREGFRGRALYEEHRRRSAPGYRHASRENLDLGRESSTVYPPEAGAGPNGTGKVPENGPSDPDPVGQTDLPRVETTPGTNTHEEADRAVGATHPVDKGVEKTPKSGQGVSSTHPVENGMGRSNRPPVKDMKTGVLSLREECNEVGAGAEDPEPGNRKDSSGKEPESEEGSAKPAGSVTKRHPATQHVEELPEYLR